MNLSRNEMRLEVICRNTTTFKRCEVAADILEILERHAQTVDEADDIITARDLMYFKGDIFALKRNQEYQLMEGQKAFVGE